MAFFFFNSKKSLICFRGGNSEEYWAGGHEKRYGEDQGSRQGLQCVSYKTEG